MIPPDTVTSLKLRLLDYVHAIGIETRRAGSRFLARCPMHEDRSPSFAIFGARHESCGCYPCGFSGDVFALSQRLGRSGSFQEAVQEVAARIGLQVPQAGESRIAVTSSLPKREKTPIPPFILSDSDREKIHAARLAFSDAFHSGDPIVDRITESLGLDRETLRLASFGSSGLGLANGWLCYAYRDGLKWRNPNPSARTRFKWITGNATAPWRAEWIQQATATVYVTEGESDCLALIESGIEDDLSSVCVAIPGAKNFKPSWAEHFTGKRAIICFDMDKAGKEAAETVAAALRGHASEIYQWKGPARHE